MTEVAASIFRLETPILLDGAASLQAAECQLSLVPHSPAARFR